MRKFLPIIASLLLFAACTNPPIQVENLDGIHIGQKRDDVLAHLNTNPSKVIHSYFQADTIIAYYYQVQTGLQEVSCNGPIGCRPTPVPVTTKYIFIFRGANPPVLAHFGTVNQLKNSMDTNARKIITQLEVTTEKPLS